MYGLPVVSQARRVASGTSPVRSDTTIKQSITRSLSAWLCYVNEPLLTADCRPITDGPLSPEKRPISHLAHRMNERLFTALAARKRPGRFPPYFHIAQRRYSHSSYYASGKQRCCAPAGATEMRLDWQGYHLGTGLAHDHRRLRIW